MEPEGTPLLLAADRDDDDADGRPDGEQEFLPPAGRVDLVALDRTLAGATLHPLVGADRLRVVVGGRPLAWDRPLPPGAALQGLLPGMASLVVTRGGRQTPLTVQVRGVVLRDGAGKAVDMARDHASLERTPPERVIGGPSARYDDPDALRVVTEVPEEVAASGAPIDTSVQSLSASGTELDVLHLAMGSVPCEAGARDLRCSSSVPVRFVVDEVDEKHPLVQGRSVRAEVGGAIVVRHGNRKVQSIRVLGPRASEVGPIGRLRATLRPFVMRVAPAGGPAIGGTDAGAIALLRGEVSLASAIWGQCGLTFGAAASVDVRIADPPPPHLVAFGDDLGLPASGGTVRLRVEGRDVVVPAPRGASPARVADAFVRALEKIDLVGVVSSNARIAPGAGGSVDVSVRHPGGRLAAVDAPPGDAPISTDATLVVRIGSVDLGDGLQHFGDMDSVAGTLEERTLIKALDDGDPRTIEVIVVPYFGGGGRIGESFIASDLSSVRNVVILDRAGIRARRSSLTLAHELGHVLMDMPGHPDDYGIDTPTRLMDSDGSDASPFGPRRLTVEECARVVRQAGPSARTPLLVDWPLTPLPAIVPGGPPVSAR